MPFVEKNCNGVNVSFWSDNLMVVVACFKDYFSRLFHVAVRA